MKVQDPAPSDPLVSCLIPCRNEARHIEKCLAGILSQSPPEGGFEIIVADGESDDGTQQILESLSRRHHNLRVINNPGRIVSCGLNVAIAAARGRIIVRMDAHTEYAPDYIVTCLSALKRSKADNVGGPWVARGTDFLSEAIAASFASGFAVGGARGHDPSYEGEVDTVYLGCWPKKIFERFGGFDEELVRNQDDEHNLRLTRGGAKVYQSPEIRSWYHPRSSLSALFKQYMQYGYWKVRVIRKHKYPASWRHLIPALFLLWNVLGLVLCVFDWALKGRPFHGLPLALISISSACYVAAVVLGAAVTARRTKPSFFLPLMAIFPCYHFGYGYGFLRGLVDFGLLGRKAGSWATRITRKS